MPIPVGPFPWVEHFELCQASRSASLSVFVRASDQEKMQVSTESMFQGAEILLNRIN